MRAHILVSAAIGLAALARAPPARADAEGPEGDSVAGAEVRAPAAAHAPVAADGVDTSDLLMLLGWRKGAAAVPVIGKFMTIAVPTISASPTVGVAIGVGASTAVLLGDPSDTMVSSGTASLTVTTKSQLILSIKSVVLTPHNEWELVGDWRLSDFSESTYGIGTASPTPVSGGFVVDGIDTAALPGAQPMKFRYLRFHETVFHRVAGPFYAGAGYHLDRYDAVVDELLDVGAAPPSVTSHYAYSLLQGFDPSRYTVSGLSIDGLYESRDHTVDPQRGTYARIAWQVSPTWLGSSRRSSLLQAEYRTYLGVSETRRRHLVAFWVLANAVLSGEMPYLTLPALGYDARGRSGRGYAAGRFRGDALVYGEVEYRFPLTQGGVLGGVLFVNATTASRPAVVEPSLGYDVPRSSLFDAVRPAGGAGLRVMLDRRSRMNLAVDFGWGVGGSTGVYLSVGEAF